MDNTITKRKSKIVMKVLVGLLFIFVAIAIIKIISIFSSDWSWNLLS